jgi:hypothetical protein
MKKGYIFLILVLLSNTTIEAQQKKEQAEETYFYIVPSGGILRPSHESFPAAGVKIGFAQKGLGRIGPMVMMSVPDGQFLTVSFIDYDYLVPIFKYFSIVPALGLGLTYNNANNHYYYLPRKNSLLTEQLSLNAGASIEGQITRWLAVRFGTMAALTIDNNHRMLAFMGGLAFIL